MENSKIPQSTQTGPVVVSLGAVAGPQVHGQPKGLLSNKVGVSRPRPEATDNKAPLKVFSRELVLVGLRNTRVGLVLLLSSLELPLLPVGEEFNDDEEKCSTGEGQVRKAEDVSSLIVCGDNKNVGGSGDEKEQQRLSDCNESEVEDHEKKAIVHFRAHDLPAVIFRANRVSPFAPVVESQANLFHNSSQHT